MTRRRFIFVFGPVLVLLLLAGTFAWLLQTESGAGWLWNRIAGAVPGLSAERVRGDLRTGLDVTGLEYASEGVTVRLDRAELRLAFDLLPPSVTVEWLNAGRLEIQPRDDGDDGSPPDRGELLEGLALPVPLRVEDARLTELVVLGAGAEADPSLALHDLSFAASWSEAIELRPFAVNTTADATAGVHLEGAARLELEAPFALTAEARVEIAGGPAAAILADPDVTRRAGAEADFDADAAVAPDDAPGDAPDDAPDDAPGHAPTAFTIRLAGDLRHLAIEASAEHTTIVLDGTMDHILTAPEWALELQADRVPLGRGADAIAARRLSVSGFGTIDRYRVELAGGLVVPGQESIQLTLSGAGDLRGLDVEFAQATHPAGTLTAEGALGWADGLRATASASVERLDPGHWVDDWPAGHPLAGTLSAAWTVGELRITDFRLSAADTDFEARGQVTWSTASDQASGELRWRDLSWPIGAEEPAFTSPSGDITLSGRPQDWRAAGQVRLEAAGLPEGQLALNASGSLEQARVEVERGALLGGTFEGNLEFDWSGTPAWSADVTARDLRTAPVIPAYPGVLSGRLRVAGRPQAKALDITIDEIAGTLRGRDVRADGRLLVENGLPRAEALRLRSGGSEVALDGNPRQPGGLKFRADVASLADLLDGAAGQLQAEGRLTLTATVPGLELSVEGTDLAWNDWRAGSVSIQPQQLPGAASAYRVIVDDAILAGYAIDEIELRTSGEEPLRRIRANAQIGGTRMTALLEGGVQDWQKPLASGWRGRIEELRADHDTLGFLELQEPARFAISAGGLALDRACLLGTRRGEACLEANWVQPGELLVTASFDAISLDLLRLLATTEVAFSHRLTGSAEWRVPRGGSTTAAVRIQVSPGEIVLPDQEASVVRTGPGLFAFEIRDGQLTAGELDLPIEGAGTIDTDFRVPDLTLGADSPVEARIRLELADVGPIASLIPHLDVVNGRVSADLRVTGTISDPDFTGHATLVDGRIENYATGLVLSDIRLAGAVYEHDFTELNGTFRAGEGTGQIKATLGFGDPMNPAVTLELTGQNLTLVDVPDLGLTADPNLRLSWNGGAVGIDGRVVVSEARLSPRYLPTETVTESPDVVIVAGPGAEPAGPTGTVEPTGEASGLKLNGRVQLVLGEDVTVNLEQAEVDVGGTVTFIWNDQLVPIGDGTLTVDGEIRAYGQLLRITEGRIRFPRRSADNPMLDIKAEREIYGNPRIRAAGVHVTGPADRPTIEPYTDPMTTHERAVTLLVTGRELDAEQGTGGLAVGMYVAPRLYVSYGLGLFGDQNVITARYDLKGGLGIRATSGQRETGVDISYTIED